MMDVIFDIDGTLCDIEHRRHHITGSKKDWDAFHAACAGDTPRWPIISLAWALKKAECQIILATGRYESNRAVTCAWMARYGGFHLARVPLYMRADGDMRDDTVIKREMLDRMRRDGYNPVMAIEDRARVVAMWREAGLVALQCDVGDF